MTDEEAEEIRKRAVADANVPSAGFWDAGFWGCDPGDVLNLLEERNELKKRIEELEIRLWDLALTALMRSPAEVLELTSQILNPDTESVL